MNNKIYFHLPGFYELFKINSNLINIINKFPKMLKDNICIGSFYGTFPSAIWNGGRLVAGYISHSDMKYIINYYNSFGYPIRFTWTNTLLEKKHTYDTYCNLIMKEANNGLNQVLVNSNILENYIRKNYSKYPIISSTTKVLTSEKDIFKELNEDYHLIVLDYSLNHDWEFLEKIKNPNKIELLVDECCAPNCKLRKQHYEEISRSQLNFENFTFQCQNKNNIGNFEIAKEKPQFISNYQITNEYVPRGFVNFKLVGRNMSSNDYVIDSYLYYLIKDEYKEKARKLLLEGVDKYEKR